MKTYATVTNHKYWCLLIVHPWGGLPDMTEHALTDKWAYVTNLYCSFSLLLQNLQSFYLLAIQNKKAVKHNAETHSLDPRLLPRLPPLHSSNIKSNIIQCHTHCLKGEMALISDSSHSPSEPAIPLRPHLYIPCCFGTSLRPIKSQLVAPKTSSWPLTLDPSSFYWERTARG